MAWFHFCKQTFLRRQMKLIAFSPLPPTPLHRHPPALVGSVLRAQCRALAGVGWTGQIRLRDVLRRMTEVITAGFLPQRGICEVQQTGKDRERSRPVWRGLGKCPLRRGLGPERTGKGEAGVRVAVQRVSGRRGPPHILGFRRNGPSNTRCTMPARNLLGL